MVPRGSEPLRTGGPVKQWAGSVLLELLGMGPEVAVWPRGLGEVCVCWGTGQGCAGVSSSCPLRVWT